MASLPRTIAGVAASLLSACQVASEANFQDERAIENRPSPEGAVGLHAQKMRAVNQAEPISALEGYPKNDMQRAFYSVFGHYLSTIVYFPQNNGQSRNRKLIPFSVAPVALEWAGDEAILITSAVSENESASLIPGSDLYYIGVYYLREKDSAFKVRSSYPMALQYWGVELPRVSSRFTGQPVLISGGVQGMTWMGASRHWDELYALKGGEPELIGIVPTLCAQTYYTKKNNEYRETSGKISEIVPGKGFVVQYRGDVSVDAKWVYKNDKFEAMIPYPDLCENDYEEQIRAAAVSKPVFKGDTEGSR